MKTTIDLPEQLHRELKARAALNGLSINDIVRDLVRDYLGDRTSVAKVSQAADAVSKATQQKASGARPMPDFSKTAQAKGRMGR